MNKSAHQASSCNTGVQIAPKKMELLAPAGNFEQLGAAIIYGADAVYLGGQENSLRARGFSFEDLSQALDLAHQHKVLVYYCMNAFPQGVIDKTVLANLEKLNEKSPDGLIIADPGLFSLARKYSPQIPIHVSTQANTCNSSSASFWYDQGATRVNLARELNFKQIREIIRAEPRIEYECFVHGAMCLALSGKCLLSAWVNKRSANLGKCTQPCRFSYKATAIRVEEEKRINNPLWEVLEEEEYSSFWSTNDLCLIEYIKYLQNAGVQTFKIEGRMRTGSYTAQVLRVYRRVLNSLYKKEKLDFASYYNELGRTVHRSLSTGFFLPEEKVLAVESNKTSIIAKIEEQIAEDKFAISIKGIFDSSQKIAILLPNLEELCLEAHEYSLENHLGQKQKVLHSGIKAFLRLDKHKQIKSGLYLREA